MDFREVDRRYVDLKRQHDNGNLSAEEFDAQLEQMMVAGGRNPARPENGTTITAAPGFEILRRATRRQEPYEIGRPYNNRHSPA